MSHPENEANLERHFENALSMSRLELIAELGFSSPETGIGVTFVELATAVANKRFYEGPESPC